MLCLMRIPEMKITLCKIPKLNGMFYTVCNPYRDLKATVGIEPMVSVILVHCSTSQANKALKC